MAMLTQMPSMTMTWKRQLRVGCSHKGWMAYPDVRKGRIQRFQAIIANRLCDDGYQGHENPDKTVLEYSQPDNLRPHVSSTFAKFSPLGILTLNHVSPLLGVLNMPRSPPQHFLNQVKGQTQDLGLNPRK